MERTRVIGIDYGTDSVRLVLVDPVDGSFVAESVADYLRWKKGLYCDPAASQFRQHPLDYIEGLETAMAGLNKTASPDDWAAIRGLCVDTTGSSPALRPDFSEEPDAMFWLWKDHSATPEAEAIKVARAAACPRRNSWPTSIPSSRASGPGSIRTPPPPPPRPPREVSIQAMPSARACPEASW